MTKYEQYNLLLDKADEEEAELIQFLEDKHGKKRKNSYSAILKDALKLYKTMEEAKIKGDISE